MKNLARFYESTTDVDSGSSFKNKQRKREKGDLMANNRKKRNDVLFNYKKK